jgi:hypothetical protein
MMRTSDSAPYRATKIEAARVRGALSRTKLNQMAETNYWQSPTAELLAELTSSNLGLTSPELRRDGAETSLPVAQLVPGNIVRLAAGDLVPAGGVRGEAVRGPLIPRRPVSWSYCLSPCSSWCAFVASSE